MKEVILKRLVALEVEQGYIYEIEMDYILGDSIEDVEHKIRWIINTDKSVLGIETICLVQDPVIRDVVAA